MKQNDDLLGELTRATEPEDAIVLEENGVPVGEGHPLEFPEEDPDDFEPDLGKKKEPVKEAPEETNAEEEEHEINSAAEILSEKYYRKKAKRWISKIDLGLKYSFKPIYRSTMLMAGDQVLAKKLYYSKFKVMTEKEFRRSLDEKEEEVWNRYEEYINESEKIQLSSDEKEELIDALAAYMEEIKKTGPSAGSMLAISVIAILAARLEPVLPGLFDKIMSLFNGK